MHKLPVKLIVVAVGTWIVLSAALEIFPTFKLILAGMLFEHRFAAVAESMGVPVNDVTSFQTVVTELFDELYFKISLFGLVVLSVFSLGMFVIRTFNWDPFGWGKDLK